MKTAKITLQGLAFIIIAMLLMPAGLPANYSDETDRTDWYSEEELAQMLAPIALYPDSLIAQMLMASTYPLEVVEAERWIQRNKHLKGDALNYALREKPWDPSIKSLCHFPDVLIAMSDELELTRKLGDAFLIQEDDVMATIQLLRRKAEEQGNLRTTGEQTVIIEREIIRIEPADPQVVYVPLYNPVYVYGPWWYPDYPPYYWYYRPGVNITGGFISFGPRFFIGYDLFSWSWFDWHSHHIYVDVHKARRFHSFHDGHASGRYFWQHDPGHRKGVAYKGKRTNELFGQRLSQRSRTVPETRGYSAIERNRRAAAQSMDRIKSRIGTDMSQVRTERERIRRSEESLAKVSITRVRPEREKFQKPDERRAKADTPRVGTEAKKIQKPDERSKRANTPMIRTEPEKVQRYDERRASVDTPKIKVRTEKIQKPEGRNTSFREIGNNFERKAGKHEVENRRSGKISRQDEDTKHQNEDSLDGNQSRKRQGRGFRG